MFNARIEDLSQRRNTLGVIAAFLLGFIEYRSGSGMTYDDDPYSSRSVAYDRGRDLAHRLTLRRWD